MNLASILCFILVGIIIDILIVRHNRLQHSGPFVCEWKFDDGVSSADENKAISLMEQYGKKDEIKLPESFHIHNDIKSFIEEYASLEFDDFTMDYDRKEFLKGERPDKNWGGFYCIGSDGGEILLFVRKSDSDDVVYAFDMEGSLHPEPYSSNIRRFIVMRYNAWMGIISRKIPRCETF